MSVEEDPGARRPSVDDLTKAVLARTVLPCTWAFDVDGCLVDSLTGRSLRPLARQLLEALREAGCVIVLWSAGGREHAWSRAAELVFTDLVDAYYGKQERGADGCWLTSHLSSTHVPAVCVDDHPDEIPSTAAAIGVRPYIAPADYDRGLESLLHAIAIRVV